MNNLKQYFEYEKNNNYNINSDFEIKNSFIRTLNNLNIKEIKIEDTKKNKNLVSIYFKYFIALSAPVAMAMFGFLFLNINKIQSNPEAKVVIESQDMNLAMSQQSDVEASEISDISMMSASVMLKSAVQEEVLTLKPENIEIYKNEVLNLIADLKDFEESFNIEI